MKELIKRLKDELYSEPAPGEVLNRIADDWIEKLSSKYNHNHDLLLIGSYLADIKIWDALQAGKLKDHVPMAIEYTKKIVDDYAFNNEQRGIVLEIISTHHGGEQKHIESKIFKNADCFKFLEPKGILHIFAARYDDEKGNDAFKVAADYALFKLEEKFSLVDLDEDVMSEARLLYEKGKWMLERAGASYNVPDLYK